MTLRSALLACEEYFEQRADAEIDASGTHGNEEMQLLVEVRRALATTDVYRASHAFLEAWGDGADDKQMAPLAIELGRVLRACDSDGSPKGRDREDGLDAKHDSAGPKDIAQNPHPSHPPSGNPHDPR